MLALGCTALTAAPAGAQNLEAFEIETIVDPLALRLSSENDEIWLDFFGVYLQTGYSEDYQAGPRFTGEGTSFGDLLTTYIHRKLQVSARLTVFDSPGGVVGDPRRWELAVGRYLQPEGKPTESVSRIQVSVARTEAGTALDRHYWSFEYDLLQPGESTPGILPWDSIVRFRLAYAEGGRHRLPAEREPSVDAEEITVPIPGSYQLSLESRSRTATGWEGLAIDFGLGLGVTYRDGRSEIDPSWLTTGRFEMRLEYRMLQDRLRLVGVYAPAYQFNGGLTNRRWNHETTVYLHVPLALEAFRSPWHNGPRER